MIAMEDKITPTGKTLTRFDIWERKLLDFSLRNTLLNLSLRRRAVQFISFEVNRVEDYLQEGKEFRITSRPDVELRFEPSGHILQSCLHEELHDLIADDIEHHLLHTFLPEGDTKNILRNIYRAARNAIEESGANSLFLAIGTLRWYESEKHTTPRYAPLLLLPVEIIYKRGCYYIRTRDEEITLNITLMEFLRQNYDIDVKGLSPLPHDASGVDVPQIFDLFREALKQQYLDRWAVEEECVLGIFSFSKFLMWYDVHNHRKELSDNAIISSLIANRLTWTPRETPTGLHDIDRKVSPIEIAIPVAVDSSQMAAVIEGGAGNSFILYGPPGTGKSQTITNLIANALYHGKRVLFVAEKMAALSVVQTRLAKIGLDPFCLELHSNKSTKRHVLHQLDKALQAVHIKSPSNFAAQADRVFERRKELAAYIDALHTPDREDGLSPYDCILMAESIDAEPLKGFRYDKEIDTLIAEEGIRGIDELLGSRLPAVVRLTGNPSMHPLKGLRVERDMLAENEKTAKEMKEDSEKLDKYRKDSDRLSETGSLREKLVRDNAPSILDEDPQTLRREWRNAKGKWFIPRFFAKRSFINRLRRHNPLLSEVEVETLIEDLTTYHSHHERIVEYNRIIKDRFDKVYGDEEVPDSGYLEEFSRVLARWSEHSSEMRDWLHWNELCGELRKNGMGCVGDAIEAEPLNPLTVVDSFKKALFLHKAKDKLAGSEVLDAFEGMLFDEKTAAYRRLVDKFQQLTRKELYARLASRVPRTTDSANNSSELGLLKRNICNGGRGVSLRDLFDQLPTLLPRLCPVMLMSPMSVAQYLDLSGDRFDLVVFDEASQMPTSEAVGAIARGRSLIVVGDPKQMPPTSFFSTNSVDDDEVAIDDMESILDDCRTLTMPALQLSWHYRSRHESLISFSNNEYYGGSLITFPSTDDRDTKIHFVYVKGGCYDKGGQRSNKVEAQAIVDEIARRLSDGDLRHHSIGVIAFSIMQQGLIEDLLQDRFEMDPYLQEAAAELHEPIFVKNLENVQGDERDVIFFSIGYGPDKEGKISMNFGPLNNTGGERRLNVAVSRARQEMYVFSTLKSSDIDLSRSKAKGVEGLKHFLQYAEMKTLPSMVASNSGPAKDGVIARRIAAELAERGYKTEVNLGRSRFRVDVAVERKDRPGSFALAILLDGYAYRATATTRDREVVQPSVLQSLGWKVMRVWSVDWMRNRERVIDRIIERLDEDDPLTPEVMPTGEFDVSREQESDAVTNAREYRPYAPHPMESAYIPEPDLVRNIVACEQPITLTLLCRRVSAVRGNSRVSPKLQNAVKAYARQYYTDRSGAVWLSERDSSEYASYRPDSGREISDIPEAELINAIAETLAEQVALGEDALMQAASRKMGYTRRGANVDMAFRKALQTMKDSGRVEAVGDRVRMR